MAKTRTPTGNEDYNFFRCKRCKFPCDLSRDRTGTGEGLRYDTLSRETRTGTGPDDPVVTSGCPQCGCKNYINWQK